MAMSPPLIASSPATMRSSVDLPQPDGPTITMNSRSAISASMPWITCSSCLPLPYFLTTLRKEMDAMALLFLRVHEATYEPLLHQDDHDGGRQHRQDGGGHHHVPLDVDLAEDQPLDAHD